jgi:hypothetical protein
MTKTDHQNEQRHETSSSERIQISQNSIRTDIVGHALGGLVRKVATHHAKVETVEQEQHAGRAERVAKQQRETENIGHDHEVAADRGRKAHLVDNQEELVHLNAQTQDSQICECKRECMFSQ